MKTNFFINLLISFIFLIDYTISINEFSTVETSKCMKISPKLTTDCTGISFNTLVCCYYYMTAPDTGAVCVPMSLNSKGISNNNVNTVVPFNITLTGNFTCETKYISFSKQQIIIFLATIVFLLF